MWEKTILLRILSRPSFGVLWITGDDSADGYMGAGRAELICLEARSISSGMLACVRRVDHSRISTDADSPYRVSRPATDDQS